MKRAFTLLLLTSISLSARSQLIIALLFGDKLNTGTMEFGLVGGPVLSNLTNSNSEYRSGFNLGLYFNIHPEKKFHIHLELTAKGSLGGENIKPYPVGNDSLNYLFENGSVERIIRSFNVVLMGRYTLSPHFFLDAGIQPDLMFKSKDVFSSDVNGSELQYSIKLNEQINRLDFCLAGGLFYRFGTDRRSMGIGVRYVYGLTDVDKVHDGTQANTSWMATITIPVGAGKSQAAK